MAFPIAFIAQLAFRLPGIIKGAVELVDNLKTPGQSKKQAVLNSIPEGLGIVEYAAGKDLLNDASVAALISAYVDAEAAVLKARKALTDVLVAQDVEPS